MSGLRAGLNGHASEWGYRKALKQIAAEKPLAFAGKRFLYSDINFVVLGELVARISTLPLERYCAQHIFARLGMKDTGFKPQAAQRSRIAPTTDQNDRWLGSSMECWNPG